MAFLFPDILRKIIQKKFDLSTDYEKVIFIDIFVAKISMSKILADLKVNL